MKIKESEGLLTPQEVCNTLRVCRKTLTRYENIGLIQPIQLNRRVFRYDPADVTNLLERLKRREA